MFLERDQYSELLKLFKYSLLITPSTANVERGFSVLGLLVTKQQNSLSPKSIDWLMRLNLIGSDDIEEETWETIVDLYQDSRDRRIIL